MLQHPLRRAAALACLSLISPVLISPFGSPAFAAPPPDPLSELRQQIDELRQQYETRLRALEERVQQARDAAPASDNAFNPQVSLILSGTYAHLQRDPRTWHISGFVPSGDMGPGQRSFNLGESELGLYANIDPWFFGGLNLAVAPDNTVSTEEAFVQTTALPHGLRLKVGRFFSGIGYLNEQHAHTWDFVDSPLAYQAFLGTQLGQDGVQVKWLLPTDRFMELGAELGNGTHFPGSEHNSNGAGSQSLFAHTGGDWSDSSSWRAGVSYLWTEPKGRAWDAADLSTPAATVTNAFTGRSRLWLLDGVWKWAPNGNATHTNFKLQGEYFHRTERGQVSHDTAALNQPDTYRSAQSGWYVQGVYQFMPQWRVGLRQDQLDSGTVDYASNNAFIARPDFRPRRTSLMLDWSLSEFSRWRVQFSNDHARQDNSDLQFFVQYQMSLGAHGAHSY
ncbi:MAG: hypothetical protein KGL90_11180 [Burkholderiales bacterium]|nr:hypothetical protein [Burkholderiales bacterium]